MSNESPPKTSGSPNRRDTTSDKAKKSSSLEEKSSDKDVPKEESKTSVKNSKKNSSEAHEKTSEVKTGSQGSTKEKQRKATEIWCDTTDTVLKENQKSTGGTQILDCTQTNSYHTPDPRAGYLQAQPPGLYPLASPSNIFPPALNFPPQLFQQSNRNNERFSIEEQRRRNMMAPNGCKPGWRDEFLHPQTNYPNAPQQFQMLPRAGNARTKNNCNNKVQGNYVQPRMVYSDALDKPPQNYPPYIPMPSQSPGVYSHNYFQDPGYNVRSPRKFDRPAMQNYGKKETDRQRGLKTPVPYYPDQRDAMNYKRAIPISEDYRFNRPDTRDPRFGGNRQYTDSSPKYPNDMRYTDGVRKDFMRYPSPPERLLGRDIGYHQMAYPPVDQKPVHSIRYTNPPNYPPPPAEYNPCMFMNQEKAEKWHPSGIASPGSIQQNLNVPRPLMDFRKNSLGEYMDEARARHEQLYYDPGFQVSGMMSNEHFDYPSNMAQKRPMINYNQPPMMPPMMPQMIPPIGPPMYPNPPAHYQGVPPQQMQQESPECYGVLLDDLDSAHPTGHLRRCVDFPEVIHQSIPEGCEKKNASG